MIMKHKEYSKEELPERIVPFGRDPFGNS